MISDDALLQGLIDYSGDEEAAKDELPFARQVIEAADWITDDASARDLLSRLVVTGNESEMRRQLAEILEREEVRDVTGCTTVDELWLDRSLYTVEEVEKDGQSWFFLLNAE